MKVFFAFIAVIALLSVVALGQAVQTPSNLIGPCWVLNVKDGDTLALRLPDQSVIDVRYMGMSAPELEAPFGLKSQEGNEELITTGKVWLELESTPNGYLTGHDGRVLAYVFTDTDDAGLLLIQEQLIRDGLAMLDPRGASQSDSFVTRYADKLIAAQIDAAFARRGLWSLPAFSPDKDFVIAAIDFWSNEEVVWFLNRGSTPIELADDWVIKDRYAMEHEGSRNTLKFERYFGPTCSLAPGGVLRIYTGQGTPKEKRGTVAGCGSNDIELWWFGYTVWDQNGDTCFLFAPDGTEYYHYTYPPFKDVEEGGKLKSHTASHRCSCY